MTYFIIALVSLLAGGLLSYLFSAKAIQDAKKAELWAKSELAGFKHSAAVELDKLEDVPAAALAALKNLVHGTAKKTAAGIAEIGK